jgi:RimJ/RimL family protein N-acetyltransferase
MTKVRLRADVTIGPLRRDFAATMFSWMQDPDVSANIGLSHTPTLEKTLEWIDNAALGESVWAYGIFLNARHAGNVVIDQIDRNLGAARLSVYVGTREARGDGVGLTGMYRALRDGFVERDLHKVWLTVHVRNSAAIRAYIALGFQVEGILRDGFLLNGERLPAMYMGLLREDFLRVETEPR